MNTMMIKSFTNPNRYYLQFIWMILHF
jgi:hypothetical protein